VMQDGRGGGGIVCHWSHDQCAAEELKKVSHQARYVVGYAVDSLWWRQ
jgi:hypothetical protein